MIQPEFLTIGAIVRAGNTERIAEVKGLTPTTITCLTNGEITTFKPADIKPWHLTEGLLTNLGFEYVQPRRDWEERYDFVYQLKGFNRQIRVSRERGRATITAFTDHICFPVATAHQLQGMFQQFEGITLRLVD
ncbi:MAG: hypothetical protein EAZ91_12015 [Cytophagales bacterium]|nr:MAG: hypothetical protein EAZ91_12015 [Cytophagales bacterium]